MGYLYKRIVSSVILLFIIILLLLLLVISIEQKSWNINVPGFHSMDIALKIA